MKVEEKLIMKAMVLCFKECLKPEEAFIYTNLGRTALARRAAEYGIVPNRNGYYAKRDLDLIVSGAPTKYELAERAMKS